MYMKNLFKYKLKQSLLMQIQPKVMVFGQLMKYVFVIKMVRMTTLCNEKQFVMFLVIIHSIECKNSYGNEIWIDYSCLYYKFCNSFSTLLTHTMQEKSKCILTFFIEIKVSRVISNKIMNSVEQDSDAISCHSLAYQKYRPVKHVQPLLNGNSQKKTLSDSSITFNEIYSISWNWNKSYINFNYTLLELLSSCCTIIKLPHII